MIRAFAMTGRGSVKPFNEDSVVIGGTAINAGSCGFEGEPPLIAAVLDGVSQGGRGAEASSLVAGKLVDYAAGIRGRQTSEGISFSKGIASVFERARADLGSYVASLGATGFAATTVSGICIAPGGAITGFNAGDSRVYRLRAEALVQMTLDHVPSERREADWGASGRAGSECHAITRAVGFEGDYGKVDIADFGRAVSGDLYMGCTDGLSGSIDREAMKQVLSEGKLLDEVAQSLFDLAHHNGSVDNVSLFLVSVE